MSRQENSENSDLEGMRNSPSSFQEAGAGSLFLQGLHALPRRAGQGTLGEATGTSEEEKNLSPPCLPSPSGRMGSNTHRRALNFCSREIPTLHKACLEALERANLAHAALTLLHMRQSREKGSLGSSTGQVGGTKGEGQAPNVFGAHSPGRPPALTHSSTPCRHAITSQTLKSS